MIVQFHATEFAHADNRKFRFVGRAAAILAIGQAVSFQQLLSCHKQGLLQADVGH